MQIARAEIAREIACHLLKDAFPPPASHGQTQIETRIDMVTQEIWDAMPRDVEGEELKTWTTDLRREIGLRLRPGHWPTASEVRGAAMRMAADARERARTPEQRRADEERPFGPPDPSRNVPSRAQMIKILRAELAAHPEDAIARSFLNAVQREEGRGEPGCSDTTRGGARHG